jgi:hypothetical protein
MFCDTTISLIEFHGFIFLLFLFFTFLSSFPSDTSTCTGISRSRSNVSFDLSVAERQQAKIGKSDQKAFQVHFGNDIEAFQKQKCQ